MQAEGSGSAVSPAAGARKPLFQPTPFRNRGQPGETRRSSSDSTLETFVCLGMKGQHWIGAAPQTEAGSLCRPDRKTEFSFQPPSGSFSGGQLMLGAGYRRLGR